MRCPGIAAALVASAVVVAVTAPAAGAAGLKPAPRVQPGGTHAAPVHLHPLTHAASKPAPARNSAQQGKQRVPLPPPPSLSIAKSHDGEFHRGQHNALYTITVSNYGPGFSSPIAFLTVRDTLPAGLTATAINGAGWFCSLPTLTCSRPGPLAPNTQYPPIYLLVDVADNAPALVTNAATLSSSSRFDLLAPVTVLDPTKVKRGDEDADGPHGKPASVNVTVVNQNNNSARNSNHNSAGAKAKAKADVKVSRTTHVTHITNVVKPPRRHCRHH
ncbi:DUF11 domain-containing protein [Streptacidiphilus anmyonensis]|uniref:DUF11 domain-containing protein n=1 Tax=Streptacidiphilus anmyonensis TaxID=405782 RepID=UPI0013649B17|nr:DUF11 domain-containing protein [Streptacidiphilus anmyonensis]